MYMHTKATFTGIGLGLWTQNLYVAWTTVYMYFPIEHTCIKPAASLYYVCMYSSFPECVLSHDEGYMYITAAMQNAGSDEEYFRLEFKTLQSEYKLCVGVFICVSRISIHCIQEKLIEF